MHCKAEAIISWTGQLILFGVDTVWLASEVYKDVMLACFTSNRFYIYFQSATLIGKTNYIMPKLIIVPISHAHSLQIVGSYSAYRPTNTNGFVVSILDLDFQFLISP